MESFEYPLDKRLVEKEVRAVLERIDNRLVNQPIEPGDLSEEDRCLYEEFIGLLDGVGKELEKSNYSPHYAAQSVADALGLPTYTTSDGAFLRVKIAKGVLIDYPIYTGDEEGI